MRSRFPDVVAGLVTLDALVRREAVVSLDEWGRHPLFGQVVPTGDSEILAHYTTVERVASIALLRDLLLSPLRAMNDPRESADRGVTHMNIWGIVGRFGLTQDESVDGAAVAQRWQQGRNEVRMACFTADGGGDEPWGPSQQDERCYARPRMWAQYGDGSRGACVLFDRKKLEAAADAAFGDKVRCGLVYYESGYDPSAAPIAMPGNDGWREYCNEGLFSKNADWAAEREHRIRVQEWTKPDCSLPVAEAVVGLVLGPLFQPHQLPVVRAIVDSLRIGESVAQVLIVDGGVLVAYPSSRHGELVVLTDTDLRGPGVFDPP